MSTLTKENKIAILEAILVALEIEHPDFKEENSTGWDLVENTKTWLKELKDEDYVNTYGFSVEDVITYAEENLFNSPIEITKEEAIVILERMERKADLSIGISWDTLAYYINEFLENNSLEEC